MLSCTLLQNQKSEQNQLQLKIHITSYECNCLFGFHRHYSKPTQILTLHLDHVVQNTDIMLLKEL